MGKEKECRYGMGSGVGFGQEYSFWFFWCVGKGDEFHSAVGRDFGGEY